MGSNFVFFLKSFRERLWVKPLGYAVLAVVILIVARLADSLGLSEIVPNIEEETIEKLLTVISASMLGVATFAVASMVSAYASASGSATPRAFKLVIADGVSQTALSSFIGAFIYSIIGIVAVKTEFYDKTGRLVLFVLTLMIFAWVVLTFVRWVDNIARLGRMGNTLEKVERAATAALSTWGSMRTLGASPLDRPAETGEPVHADDVGYVQHVELQTLQEWADANDAVVIVHSPPGAFVSLCRPLLTVVGPQASREESDEAGLSAAFVVAETRTFSEDPRLGLIAIAEIASRALSPAVNDPGTAIEIVGRLVRIFSDWDKKVLNDDGEVTYDRVLMPRLSVDDLFEDAFGPIARDGAGSVEVGIRLQKALAALAAIDNPEFKVSARHQSRLALERAESQLSLTHDLDRVREAAAARTLKPPPGDRALIAPA